MDIQTLKNTIDDFNEEELFYQQYFLAKKNKSLYKRFMEEFNLDYVLTHHLMIPEFPETIPEQFEDSFFLDLTNDKSIGVVKHNRYTPAIEHTHTFFELIYVYKGTCKQKINLEEIHLRTGDICIIPPGVKHNVEVFDDSIILNILMRKSTLHDIFSNFLSSPNILSSFFLNNIYSQKAIDYIIFHTENDLDMKEKFIYMLWEMENKNVYYFQMISNTIMLIFGSLIRYYVESAEMKTFNEKTDLQRVTILQYLHENYATVTLEDIAEKLHYSNEYTSKIIKNITGHNFTRLLQQIRIEKAKSLLVDTNMTVSNITAHIGYDTPEHFIRTFKKIVGMTPTEFRKKAH